MTTEDDFQRALDARPDDWLCRLVLADWLQERGDPRAEGYRALGRLRLCPRRFGRHWMYQHCPDRAWLSHALRPRRGGYAPEEFVLPQSWGAAAGPGGGFANIVCRSRRDADDAAARAFAELPAARRAKLLSLIPSPKPAPVTPTSGLPRRAPARKGWDKWGEVTPGARDTAARRTSEAHSWTRE